MAQQEIKTNKIKSITPLFERIFNDEACKIIEEEYYEIKNLEERIHNLRDLIRETETLLEAKKKEFNKKSSLFNIEFETVITEVREVDKNIPLILKDGKELRG